MILALLIGTLGAALSQLHSLVWRRTVVVFVDVFRGTPLLVQVLVFYFVPTALGFSISPYVTGTLSLAFYYGAYITEIMRGAFEGVPAEHLDAARSLGMKTSTKDFQSQDPTASRSSPLSFHRLQASLPVSSRRRRFCPLSASPNSRIVVNT